MARSPAGQIVRHLSAESPLPKHRGTAADANKLAALYQHHQRIGAVPAPTAETVRRFIEAEMLDRMAPSHIDRMAGWVMARLVE
jgi:hypothetical protein